MISEVQKPVKMKILALPVPSPSNLPKDVMFN